jgi:hypothetical protein cdiviTM7_00316
LVERRIRNAQVAGSIPADGSMASMNKNSTIHTIKKIVMKNRSLMWMLSGIFIAALICSIWIGVLIHPSDITVYSRYSAFGQAHFYKEHWQYFFLFVAFFWIVAVLHSGMMIKFTVLSRKLTSKVIFWYTLAVFVVGLMYVLNVISLGQAA